MRFYLAALTAADQPISPLLKTRKPRTPGATRKPQRTNQKPPIRKDDDEIEDIDIPEGMQKIELPLIGKANVILALPGDFDADDWQFLEPILKKYIERMLGIDPLK